MGWYTDGSKTRDWTEPEHLGQELNWLLQRWCENSPARLRRKFSSLTYLQEQNSTKDIMERASPIFWIVQALSSLVIRSRMVWECRQRMNLIGRNNKVTLTRCHKVRRQMSLQGRKHRPPWWEWKLSAEFDMFSSRRNSNDLIATRRYRLWREREGQGHSFH